MSNFQAKSFISDLEDSTEVIDLQNDSSHNRLHAKKHRASPNPSNLSQQSSHGNRGSMAPIMMENGATTKSNLLMSGIFGVDDSTYDVNLYSSCVVLTIVGGKIKSKSFLNIIFFYHKYYRFYYKCILPLHMTYTSVKILF